ncbi:response regulator transcription factor [Thiocystis violacea]|uniref:response regulator transcription factor n=1 Tax=Thiocystis violacea TaxID=13725 RepID=UPI0019065CBE|nr:response regulator [Thiocystis violacea]MBK1722979.1 DNA-binding response regulator [Thiocystis violacea]
MSNAALIHVVDDDASQRTALLRLLGAAGFDTRGYACTGELLLHPPQDRPGCLLLDMHLPGPSGLELQAALQPLGIRLPVVFLTGYADVTSSVQAMKAGAVDFLAKPVQRDLLLDAIERAVARDAAQRAERQEASRLRACFGALTPRERDVFDQVVAGMLNKQIAYSLGIAERTVKMQRAQMMKKLNASSAAELGALAERLSRLSD